MVFNKITILVGSTLYSSIYYLYTIGALSNSHIIRQLADAMTERDRGKAALQVEKEGPIHDLKHAHSTRLRPIRNLDFIAKVQKEVQVYKH